MNKTLVPLTTSHPVTVKTTTTFAAATMFRMSKERELKGLKALEEHKAGQTTHVTDLKAFFNEL